MLFIQNLLPEVLKVVKYAVYLSYLVLFYENITARSCIHGTQHCVSMCNRTKKNYLMSLQH